jgi:ribose 5-phosphate isomerase A
MDQSVDAQKRAAGEAAVDRYVRDGMCVGLGTGSTALWAIRRVGERVAGGEAIVAVATSRATEALCLELHIPLVGFLDGDMAVAIDGADEVAPAFALTKGGGGALFREKSVALAAKRFIVVVDERKIVKHLGAFPTPVEVVPYALPWVHRKITTSMPEVQITQRGGSSFRTDNGNVLLDCAFGTIENPRELDARLREIHGVVATGLFYDLADTVIVAGAAGVYDLVSSTSAI